MFTGIITDIGVVRVLETRGPNARVTVATSLAPLTLGESISVDGACLTVDAIRDGAFEIDASAETLAKTTLGAIVVGTRVNLERALAAGERMGGHFVTGHVDGKGILERRVEVGDACTLAVAFPSSLSPFIAEKGSITMNGVSLTVNSVTTSSFEVMLIPHTRAHTNLDSVMIGGDVNLEVDLIARYLARIAFVGQNV